MRVKAALSGELSFMNLAEILQFLCTENATGLLRLAHPVSGGSGEIYIADGEPVDAVSPGKSGIDAFNALFAWSSGEFEFIRQSVERTDVIGRKMMAAVLDALRMVDEELIKNDELHAGAEALPAGGGPARAPIKGPSFFDYMYIVDEEAYAGGMTITEEGRYGNWLWVILDGVAEVVKRTDHGETPVALFGRGAFIGGLSSVMKSDIPRYVSFVAREEVHLGVIDTQQLATALSRLSPGFRALILSLERRLSNVCTWRADYSVKKNGMDALPGRLKPLMVQGDTVSKGYLVQEGTAYLVRTGPEAPCYLMKLEAGDFIGRVPFLELGHEPASFSVLASEDLKLTVMDTGVLNDEYRQLSGLLKHIIEFTCISIVSMTRQAAG